MINLYLILALIVFFLYSISSIYLQQHVLFSVFNHLLDDTPLPANEVSSSVLVATYLSAALQNGKGAIGGGKPAMNGEVEKGLVTLISSDSPGLQVSSYYLMMTLILKRMWFS